jgi:glycosyltransferase involved in cell wall biosynthesis
MPLPLVSIIIPVYNSAKYLAETIQSALNQTWPDIELVLINNGSTDNSLAIAESFGSEKLKIFSQENKGAGGARNRGLQEAKGDYIQFLDADDLLSPDKIEKQVAQLTGKVDLLSICHTVHFNNNESTVGKLPNAFESTY